MVLTMAAVGFIVPAFAEGDAAYLLGLPAAGGTLENGKVYAVNEDAEINGGSNRNGLVVAGGATVVL